MDYESNEYTEWICTLNEDIVSLFAQQLGDDTITIDSLFLDVGVDSLDFISIVVKIENKYNIEFADDDLNYLKFTTIKDLTTHIQSSYC